MKWPIALVVIGLSCSAALAEYKANILPKADEAKCVAAVKALKTRDGSILGETLDFVTKMRPKEFK